MINIIVLFGNGGGEGIGEFPVTMMLFMDDTWTTGIVQPLYETPLVPADHALHLQFFGMLAVCNGY